MERLRDDPRVARAAATIGVVLQIASGDLFVFYPLLTVPAPESYGFFAAWPLLVGLTIAWWRRHPWRSLLLPIVSVPTAAIVLDYGYRFLGWGP